MKYIICPPKRDIWVSLIFTLIFNPLIYSVCYNFLKPKFGIELPDLGFWEFLAINLLLTIFRPYHYYEWEITQKEE